MTDSARERILQRLRQTPIDATQQAAPEVTEAFTCDDPLQHFCEAITAAKAQVYCVDTLQQAHGFLSQLMEEQQWQSVMAAEVMIATLVEQGTDQSLLSPYGDNIEQCKERLFNQVQAGITQVKAAIAETGTLVLWPDADEPRSLSLVPPVHIALMDASTLYPDFASLMTAQQWQDGLPTNSLLISGPSKTADIQQTLAYGAHGPKELHVVIYRKAV